VRRYQQTDRASTEYTATWYDQFAGGCVTYRLRSTDDIDGRFATELSTLVGFASRETLDQALSQRSDGRLQLDPPEASQD
jgi:hypothetical protein